ncbi:MAG: efflux RND transporter periplasmic adaptor subunit [Nitrospirae bacterium]|nr:MAG: efflux RND transporter periplasmic adaptor subunit [Nitrospirota bacterium]
MEGHPMSPEGPLAPKSPRMKLLVVGVGVALLLGAGFWVLESGTQPVDQGVSLSAAKTLGAAKESGSVPEVQVVKPARRDVAATLRLPATVSPLQQTTIYAKVAGYLKVVNYDKGDRVKQGQVLAVIDAPEIEQQYEEALADYTIKKVTYERLAQVWKQAPDVIAKQDVDVAEASAKAAQHLLEQRQTWLDYTKVRAPYDGVLTARFADPGALVQGATSSATQAVPLFTIMDVSTLRFYVNVPQEDAPFVKKGTPATIVLTEPAEKKIETTVTRSTMSLDPSTRTMLVEIDIPNPGEALVSGMFVEVILTLRQHQNALVVPPAALVADSSSKAVFVVDQGMARKVSITTDIDDGVWVEVTSGLTGAEDIVVVGKSQLVDGKPAKASPYNLPSGKPSSQKY